MIRPADLLRCGADLQQARGVGAPAQPLPFIVLIERRLAAWIEPLLAAMVRRLSLLAPLRSPALLARC